MTTKLKRNRVRSLMKQHGVEKAVEVTLSEYTEAVIDLDEKDMQRWLRELQEVCSAPVATERQIPKVMPKTFSAEDTIRARGMGVLLEFSSGDNR